MTTQTTPQQEHVWTVGETDQPIEVEALDDNGAPLDCAGSAITLRMVALSVPNVAAGTVKINDAAGTAPTGAYLSYSPSAGDVDTAGTYKARFRGVRSSGKVFYSRPFIVRISADI